MAADDDWTTEELTGPPRAALTADGHPVTITAATFTDATEWIDGVRRDADELRRLFGDAAVEAGDLDAEEDES
ncbi:hypothetical protein [Dietzia cinnamea]|uniref:hypothetical protein n=1 Tax=Dietzia cinnamea TaxID=321318 RepID=UPI0021A54DE4|nr:hypothetical protein [Dietzia cinnamea]MCT2140468.1 hypothetical protein [Dietzia cinnamea]